MIPPHRSSARATASGRPRSLASFIPHPEPSRAHKARERAGGGRVVDLRLAGLAAAATRRSIRPAAWPRRLNVLSKPVQVDVHPGALHLPRQMQLPAAIVVNRDVRD